MALQQLYPIISTHALSECRDFYLRVLLAELIFESDWYLHLRVGRYELGFSNASDAKQRPIFQPGVITRGLCIGMEVDDVDAEYQRIRALGVEILGQPKRMEWGELSFRILDPAGTVITVLEQPESDRDVVEL